MGDANLRARYAANYGLSPSDVTSEQVEFHLELERRLTAEVLASSPSDRWETFERCYNELYSALPWLRGTGGKPDADRWAAILGPAPLQIYEVGSGAGRLATELAALGFNVEATDVSRERGDRRPTGPLLRWSTTDGVHLDQYASRDSYDAVITDQLVEHLHPDDIGEHLASARRLLRTGGKYIVRTPHRFTGPHDVSLVFGYDQPIGMHLHEFTVSELATACRRAGFAHVASAMTIPRRFARGRPGVYVSYKHLVYLSALERVLGGLSVASRRRAARSFKGPLRLDIFLVATA